MIRRNARVIAPMAAGLVLILGAASFAGTRTIQDARGDQGEATPDLRSASHGHTPNGKKLAHTVVTYGKLGPAKAKRISVVITTEDNFYEVSTFGVFNTNTQSYSNVTVKRPTKKSIRYIFRENQIGNPPRYQWFARSVPGFSCPLCPDYAPDGGATVTHRL